MAAVVGVLSYHGSSPTGSDITNLSAAFRRSDADTVDLTSPIPISTAAATYSWAKYTKISVISGLTGNIGNIKWFAAAAPEDWVGSMELWAKVNATYAQPAVGDEAGIGGMANANTHTNVAPLSVTAVANSITTTGTGTQDYVEQQMKVLTTATSGMKTARLITYRYTET